MKASGKIGVWIGIAPSQRKLGEFVNNFPAIDDLKEWRQLVTASEECILRAIGTIRSQEQL